MDGNILSLTACILYQLKGRPNTAGPRPGRRGAFPGLAGASGPPGTEHLRRLLVKVKGHSNICLVSTKKTTVR